MKFEIGDKIVVKLTNEEGEVIDVISESMVMVEVRGVKFPAYNDQLGYPYFKRFSEKKVLPEKKAKTYIDQVPKEKATSATKKVSDGVWLSFLPKFDTDEFGDEVVDFFKMHLQNNTDQGYHFQYRLKQLGKNAFELANQVMAFQDFYLHDVPFEDFNDSLVFECEFSLITPDKKKATHFETSLKLKPKQVFARVEEIKEKGQAVFSYKLFDKYPDHVHDDVIDFTPLSNSGYKIYDASKTRQHLAPARTEVDLHIERLTDDWKKLSNFEILTIQLKEFEKFYELAVAHRQSSLIIIHGVGVGKLRDEIHEILRTKKDVKYFVNQYHPSYGYGATEIYFQY